MRKEKTCLLILLIALYGAISFAAPSQTPDTVSIIMRREVAQRFLEGRPTSEDVAEIKKGIELTMPRLQGPVPCQGTSENHPAPGLMVEGRFPANCSDPVKPKR